MPRKATQYFVVLTDPRTGPRVIYQAGIRSAEAYTLGYLRRSIDAVSPDRVYQIPHTKQTITFTKRHPSEQQLPF